MKRRKRVRNIFNAIPPFNRAVQKSDPADLRSLLDEGRGLNRRQRRAIERATRNQIGGGK
jgi:hypothetical protein